MKVIEPRGYIFHVPKHIRGIDCVKMIIWKRNMNTIIQPHCCMNAMFFYLFFSKFNLQLHHINTVHFNISTKHFFKIDHTCASSAANIKNTQRIS